MSSGTGIDQRAPGALELAEYDYTKLRISAPDRLPVGTSHRTLRLAWKHWPATRVPVALVVEHPCRLQVDRVFAGTLAPGEAREIEVGVELGGGINGTNMHLDSTRGFVHAKFDSAANQVVLEINAPRASGRFDDVVHLSFGSRYPGLSIYVSGIVE